MIIFYDTDTREIIGVSMLMSDSTDTVKEPTFQSSFPKNPPANIGYFYTPNDATVANQLWAYQLIFNTKGKPESIDKKPPKPYIQLKTDATDKDGNGIPEIIANGKDQCSITANVRDNNGSLLTHFDKTIRFRTTGGVLFDREVKCKNGVAKTTLRSVEETLTPVITAESPNCIPSEIEIEFVLETVFS